MSCHARENCTHAAALMGSLYLRATAQASRNGYTQDMPGMMLLPAILTAAPDLNRTRLAVRAETRRYHVWTVTPCPCSLPPRIRAPTAPYCPVRTYWQFRSGGANHPFGQISFKAHPSRANSSGRRDPRDFPRHLTNSSPVVTGAPCEFSTLTGRFENCARRHLHQTSAKDRSHSMATGIPLPIRANKAAEFLNIQPIGSRAFTCVSFTASVIAPASVLFPETFDSVQPQASLQKLARPFGRNLKATALRRTLPHLTLSCTTNPAKLGNGFFVRRLQRNSFVAKFARQ